MPPSWKEDIFARGCICGFLAGIVKNFLDFCLITLKIKTSYFWKIASIIIFSRPPRNVVEHIVAIAVELTFCSFIGILYALIRNKLKTRYPLVAGMFYGAWVWFFIKASFLLFHVGELRKDLSFIANPISHLILSMLYGLIIAYLEYKWSLETKQFKH
jgi:hypothetical protein